MLVRLAETSEVIAATSSRKVKSEALAATIAELEPAEIELAVGFLTGAARQGRVGIGWAAIQRAAEEAGPPPTVPTITIAEFDRLITEVGGTVGAGSERARTDQLAAFLDRATEVERPFVTGVLLGELRQGALAGVVTDAVAKAAGIKITVLRRAVMLSGDLGHASQIALTGGAEALTEIDLEAGRPILPMLASTAADVTAGLEATGPASVEWKLDGARIQAHRVGDDIRLFTRNLNDVTDRLPGVVEAIAGLDCTSVVLDGEVLGMREVDGDDTPQAFQDTMSRLGSDGETSDPGRFAMRPFFFDLMFLDGASLIDTPLAERRTQLERVVGDLAIPAIATDDPVAAQAHLDDALATGHEGVMVKALDSDYQAGRRGKAWRKVKPVHTLELVVLAAEWGHGRRQGWLSNLHLGARDPDTGEFVMVGKTFKGLTDELLAWQTDAFLDRKTHESQSGHTVYVRNELVVEVALDGAQASTRYAGGVALRFARVRGYRPDRDPHNADTVDAVRALLPRAIGDR
ncbi:MAG: ATP-dependent DNA ligase [Acidimicrobiales bacterium]|nr:ATP-dependent DNA ligase [Acidimicrobiales bacterium]